MNAHVGKRQNSEETVGKYGWGTRNRKGQDLVEMLARKPVCGGKLLLPEEGVTQDSLEKWEQQNRDMSSDCQKLSAEQGQRLQGFGGRAHNEPT